MADSIENILFRYCLIWCGLPSQEPDNRIILGLMNFFNNTCKVLVLGSKL